MSKKLAIAEHPTRGNEVNEILGMLCGKHPYIPNIGIAKCNIKTNCYYMCDYGFISWGYIGPEETDEYKIFTLEEFLEKYPFKVGDKAVYIDDNDIVVISEIMWDDTVGDIFYNVKRIDEDDCFLCPPELLKPYKETNMNENKFGTVNELPTFEPMFKLNDEIEYKIPDGYEITEVSKDKVFIKPIKPKYPKTYKECCDVLLIPPYYNLRYHTYEHCYSEYATSNTLLSLQDKLNTLGKVIICRDAYWKIAGEEMGLDKPWKPNEDSMIAQYGIRPLLFPSKEIYNMFYDNFKDLIEQCKELL